MSAHAESTPFSSAEKEAQLRPQKVFDAIKFRVINDSSHAARAAQFFFSSEPTATINLGHGRSLNKALTRESGKEDGWRFLLTTPTSNGIEIVSVLTNAQMIPSHVETSCITRDGHVPIPPQSGGFMAYDNALRIIAASKGRRGR